MLSDHDVPALSPARQALAERIAAVRAANDALATILKPQAKFAELLRGAATANRTLDELRAADDEALAVWLGADDGSPRPLPSSELLAAERAAALAERDARAARAAQERAQPAAAAAGESVRRAADARDHAAVVVIGEIADSILHRFAEQAARSLAVESELVGLTIALRGLARQAGAEPDGAARMLAEHIDEERMKIRRTAAAQSRPEVARALFDRLRADPAAQLDSGG